MAEQNFQVDPPYRKKVFDLLATKFSDFKTNEQEFNNKLDTDPNYASKVFDVLNSRFTDFNRPKDEFISMLNPVKKKVLPAASTTNGGATFVDLPWNSSIKQGVTSQSQSLSQSVPKQSKATQKIESFEADTNDFFEAYRENPTKFISWANTVFPSISLEQLKKEKGNEELAVDAFLSRVSQSYDSMKGDAILSASREKRGEISKGINSTLAELTKVTGKAYKVPTTEAELSAILEDLKPKLAPYQTAMMPSSYGLSGGGYSNPSEDPKTAEYNKKLREVKESLQPFLNSQAGSIVLGELSKKNPNVTPIEIGREVMRITNPELYKQYKVAGGDKQYGGWGGQGWRETAEYADDINRQMAQIGSEVMMMYGNKTAIQRGVDENKILKRKFTYGEQERVKNKIASALYHKGITPSSATKEQIDQVAQTLPEEDKNFWNIAVESNNTKLPSTGFGYSLKNGYSSVVTDAVKTIISPLIPSNTRERALRNLKDMASSDTVGENPAEVSRFNQLKEKEKTGKISAQESEELKDLSTRVNILSTGERILDMAGSGTGQILGLGTISAFTGGLSSAGTAMSALRSLVFPSGGRAGISAAAYLMANEGNQREAIKLFPDSEAKQFIGAQLFNAVDMLVERLFPEEQVFGRGLKGELASEIGRISKESLTSQLADGVFKKAAKSIMRFGKELGVAPLQEVAEEELALVIKEAVLKPALGAEYDKSGLTIDKIVATGEQAFWGASILGAPKGLMAMANTRVPIETIWNTVSKPMEFVKMRMNIDQMVKDGELTKEDAEQKISLINTGLKEYNTNPVVNGQLGQLSLKQRQNYFARVMHEKVLADQISNTTDENAKAELAKKIEESKSQREKIFKNELVVNEDNQELSPKLSIIDDISSFELNKNAVIEKTAKEVGRVKSLNIELEDGATFNLSGEKYTGQGLVIPVISQNTTMEELTPEMIGDFLEKNKSKLGDSTKVGIYKFPNSNKVSIDLNIVVDPKHRDIALEFGKRTGQESLFDLGSFENVKTGADGSNPMSFTDEQFSEISQSLAKGKMPKVFGEPKSIADRLRAEVFGNMDSKVKSAQKALAKTGVVINMIEDPKEYGEKVAQFGGQRGAEGLFVSQEGQIFINQSMLEEGIADGRVIWHEASHPVVNIIRNTNRGLYDRVVTGLKEVSKNNEGVANAIEWAKKEYAQDGQGVIDDEAIVETIAGIADGQINISNISTGFKQSIIDFINAISKALGLGQIINDTDIAAFKKLAGQVANALRSGSDISEIVGEGNVKNFENNLVQGRKGAELKDDNPVFFENIKEFANNSSFPNKIAFKEAVQEKLLAHVKELRKVYGKDFDPSVYNETTKKYLSDVLTKEAYNAIAAHPEAIGWYDEKTAAALAAISVIHPEIATDNAARGAFILPLAVMSNGNKVDKNFELAEKQYSYYKANGRFNPDGDFGAQQAGIRKSLKLVNGLLDNGITMGEINSFFTSMHKAGDLKYRKPDGKLGDLVSGELAEEQVFGAVILGPKIGNGFYMNLWGEFGQLTMDRWFMRTWGRLTGTLIERNKEKIDKGKARVKTAIEKVKADKTASKTLRSVIGSIAGKSATEIANLIEKASAKVNLRNSLSLDPVLNELRKAGNGLAKNLRGEKEAPQNGNERKFIREVFVDVQKRLSEENGIDITMADLQAVMWYPEKILYESFKEGESFEDASEGYTEDSAPDYFNAAKKLVTKLGATNEQINQAVSAGRRDPAERTGRRDSNVSETAGRDDQEILGQIRVASGGAPDLVKRKANQESRGNRIESETNFKLAAFVLREKASGAPLSEIVSGIASVFPNMTPQEIKALVDDTENWLRSKYSHLSKALQDNLLARAANQNIYKRSNTPIAASAAKLSVSNDDVEGMTKKPTVSQRIDKAVTSLKNKFIDPNGGLPDWVMTIKDFASGSRQLEISRAVKTMEQLKAVSKKIGFSDWDLFSNAIKSLSNQSVTMSNSTALQQWYANIAAANKPLSNPPSIVPQAVASLPAEIIPFVFKMRGQIDRLTSDLIASGYVTPEQAATLEANIGSYVNRAYRLYNERGWKPSKEQLTEATKFLADKYIKQIATENPSMTIEELKSRAIVQAQKDVDAILNKNSNPYFGKTSIDSRDTGTLKERKDIPEPIRKLMGEYTDPGTTFVMTVAKQAALKASSEYLSKLRQIGMGSIFFEENDPKRPIDASVKLAGDNSETFSPLNGLYASPEVAEALNKIEPTYNTITNLWMKAVGAVRWGKTVGSIKTQLLNFESNIGFAVMNGLFLSGENMGALKASGSYIKGQYSNEEINKITEKVIKLNLVNQGVSATELKEMLGSGDINMIALDLAVNDDSKFRKVKNSPGKAYEFFNKVYRMGDDFWKVYAYMNERAQVAQAMFGSKYDELTTEQQDDVDVEASERVKNTWPTYDRVFSAVKKLSKNVPILGNFVSFRAESIRVLANTVKIAAKDLQSDNPAFRVLGAKRMAGITTYVSIRAMMTYALAQASGIAASGLLGYLFGDEEENRKKAALKKAAPPFMMSGDVAAWQHKDEPWKYTITDLSSIDPYNTTFKTLNAFTEGRDGMNPGPTAAFVEFFGGFFDTEMTFETFMDAVNNRNSKTGDKIVGDTDEGWMAYKKVGEFVVDNLQPSTIGLLERLSGKNPKAEAVSLLGMRPYDIDLHKSFSIKLSDMAKNIEEINKEYNKVKFKEDVSNDEKIEAQVKAEAKKAVLIQRMNQMYLDFIELGASEEVLRGILFKKASVKSTGFDTKTKFGVMSGEFIKESLYK